MMQDLEEKLISAALEGIKNALSENNKKDDFRIGASVLTKNGNIYSSGQYFSNTYSLTLHAEQCALAHAAAHGEYAIISIAIAGNKKAGGEKIIYPCNMCKQLLWENYLRSKINTHIILADLNGKVLKRLELLDMIKYPWPEKFD